MSPIARLSITLALPTIVFAGAGCNASPSSQADSSIPAEYRPYLADGKFAPTGDATLDYWVTINIQVVMVRQAENTPAAPTLIRGTAKGIRERPVAGVDGELVTWAQEVAVLLDAKADILAQIDDPQVYRDIQNRLQAGQNPQSVMDRLEVLVSEWEQARNRLFVQAERLRGVLSTRRGRPFPSPQL
jgi:hypothetical protein